VTSVSSLFKIDSSMQLNILHFCIQLLEQNELTYQSVED